MESIRRQVLKKLAIGILVGLVLGFAISFLFSCNTFKPITVDGETDECNAMYTAWAFSVNLQGFTKKGHSSGEGIATLLTKECIESWKRKRENKLEEKCKNKFYGKDEDVSSGGKEKYILYLKCLTNKI